MIYVCLPFKRITIDMYVHFNSESQNKNKKIIFDILTRFDQRGHC